MRRQNVVIGWLIAVMLMAGAGVRGAAVSDEYLKGYAAAILEAKFHLKPGVVSVKDGVIVLDSAGLGENDPAAVVAEMKKIEGVKDVRGVQVAGATTVPLVVPAAPVVGGVAVANSAKPQAASEPVVVKPENLDALQSVFFSEKLFRPLSADPRWPSFSAAYQHYTSSSEVPTHSESGESTVKANLRDVIAVSFGETLSLSPTLKIGDLGEMKYTPQAAVFSVFDLDSNSFDLVNADYYFAPIAFSFRSTDRKFSAITRMFHQSSHLGDEFIFDHDITAADRVNLSYWGVDAIFSYKLTPDLRLYGGAGYLFQKEPSDLKPWSVQYGAEYLFNVPLFGGRPLFAGDFQQREQNDWSADISLRTGIQWGDWEHGVAQLLLEYYDGHSPNGQFFNEAVQYFGLGLHFYF